MHFVKTISFVVLFQVSFSSFGQTYEAIYEVATSDIQNQMNSNKMNGIDILTGINSSFQIGLSGLLATERDAFLELLSTDPKIQSVDLSIDNSSITILANASFTMNDFNTKLATTSGIVTGSSVNYSLASN